MKKLIIAAVAAITVAGISAADAKTHARRTNDAGFTALWQNGPFFGPRRHVSMRGSYPQGCVSDLGYRGADHYSC
jgi:hypothetical protein